MTAPVRSSIVRIGMLMGLVAILVGSACARTTPKPAQSAGCIPPPVQIAYPYQTLRQPGDPDDTILPPPEWEPQLSDEQLAQINRFYGATSLVVRGNDIWFTDNNTLARYRPATGEIAIYTVQFEGHDFLPSRLFLAQDGALWGLDHYGVHTLDKIPGDLSRYDIETDRFEPAPDKEGILTHEAGYTPVTEDAQGKLWLIRDGVLFSFDPATRQAQRVLDEQRGYRSHNLVGAPDGSIWLAVYKTDPPGDRPVIVRYDPGTDTIEYHGPPPGAGEDHVVSSLYLDSGGRLWVDDYGWREFPESGEPMWYKLIRSPVFITNRMQGAGDFQYGWTGPSRMYESSNGLFWFTSGAGLVRLDFQSAEWCLVTTLFTPIVEDTDHNLWIAGNRQLYRYPLQP